MAKTNKTIQAILQGGRTSEFWKLICDELDEDILRLEKELHSDEVASMPAIEYKLTMENLKDRIKYSRDLKEKPQQMIQNLDNPEEPEENDDPYEK